MISNSDNISARWGLTFRPGFLPRLTSVETGRIHLSPPLRGLLMRFRQQLGRRSALRSWGILAFVSALTALSTLLSAAQADRRTASANLPRQSHGASALVRVPVVDGNDIRFSRLSTARGLSQTRVLQIVEDNQGFIWFGTQYGLDRFDGYEYKVFVHDPARENSLNCVYIHSLFKDRSGTLWVGCDSSLDRFDSITETFTHHQILPAVPGEVVNAVEKISQDRAGLLWLSTGQGLFRLNPDTGEIIHYIHDSSNSSSLGSNEIKSTLEDSSGRFWVIAGNDLEEFDRNSGRVLLRFRLADVIRDTSLYEDRFGILWVTYDTRGNESGLAAVDRSTNRLIPYSLYDKRSGKGIYGGFFAVLEDKNKTLWFANFGGGLLKFDREHKVFIRYRNHPNDIESIGEDRVISLCEDHEGNIWVGLHAREPDFFRSEPSPFTSLSRNQYNPNSLGETFVNAIFEDREGVLWTATTGGLNRIDQRSGESVSYPIPGHGESNDIIAINEDATGILWVGQFGGGLSQFDRETGRFKTYLHEPSNPSSLSDNRVSRLLLNHDGTMWITTWNGLDRFDPKTGRFTTYKQDKNSDEEAYFNITEDQTGSLWMGSWGAVNRFDPKTGQFTRYPYKAGDPKSLSSDESVNSVFVDHSGTIWAATYNGLNKFNRETGTFTHYFVKDGLPTDNLSCMLEDRSGMLWMSTSRGLSRFDPVANKFTNYSTADGLPGNDLTGWDACFKSPSGEMFFGGFNGGVAFFPDKVVDRRDPLPLVLTDFRLGGRSVEVGRNSPLQKSINYANDVSLSHDQNIFSVSFAALTFLNPDANRYRYKLEDLEHDWTEVGSDRRVATYTTLPAGKYTFHVQSATRQGDWGEPGLALTINILPPWWATTWFRLLAGVFVLGIVGTIYKLRLQQLDQQFSAQVEARVAERTRIARDLHDTLLQSFHGLMFRFQAARNMLPRSPENAMRTLDEAISSTRAAITESRDAIHDLRSKRTTDGDLAQLLEAEAEELAAVFGPDQNSPTFRVIVEGERQRISPALHDELYRIAREVMRNAFRHAGASKVEAEIRYDKNQLRLRVRDNGRGLDPKVLEVKRRPGHWGLAGISERAQQIGAELRIWSEDRAGTEIELTVPDLAYKDVRNSSRSKLSPKDGAT
jgi:signal transduction histidine kinase/ligand-binding sensor domain-containing protein